MFYFSVKYGKPLLQPALLKVLSGLFFLSFFSWSQAAVVFEQSPLDGGDGPASFFEEQTAEDFSLTADTEITSIQWWGSFVDDTLSDNVFDIRFFNDNGGLPSDSAFQTFNVTASRSSTSLFDSFQAPVFLFETSLNGLNLLANTPYYVSIVHPADQQDDEFYWLQSDTTGTNFHRNTASSSNWSSSSSNDPSTHGNLAFRLLGNQQTNNVPEPGSLVLFAIMFLMFSFKRYFSRR